MEALRSAEERVTPEPRLAAHAGVVNGGRAMDGQARSGPPAEPIGDLVARRFGAGPPLFLFHGGAGSWTHWSRNVETLKKQFTVVAVDLPGFGEACRPTGLDPELYLDRVAGAAAVAVEGPFALAGFSFGAVVAAGVACRLRGRITSLSLLGPGGFGEPQGREIRQLKVPPEGSNPAARRRAAAFNLGQFMLSRAPDEADPVVDLYLANIARIRFDSRRLSLQNRLLDDLAQIACPLQLIWGALDRLAVPSIQTRVQSCLHVRPDAVAHTIEGAGHWVQFEAPEITNQLLIKFHQQAQP